MFEADFINSSDISKKTYLHLLDEIANLIAASLPKRAYNGKNAQQLSELIDREFLPSGGLSRDQILGHLNDAISNSINVSHPNTIAHLHCPPLLSALSAELVISALNQSMDSFDQAPFATVLEQRLIEWLCREIGFAGTSGGTLTAGGSQSNYQALLLARDAFAQSQWNWSVQKSGLPPEFHRMRVLCSEVAHFTVEKSAAQLGLGTDAVIRVKTDQQFRMDPDGLRSILEHLRKDNLLPFAIVATAGTTDFGSIDPLTTTAGVARSVGAWLHVDAAYGGALIFSARHRQKLAGIELADSVSIDFHKLLWQPMPCSALLVSNKRHFGTMRIHADYLNPESHDAQGIPNLVTDSLLTTRRFDALKIWISFQALGHSKLAAMIDRTLDLAAYAGEAIRNNSRFALLHAPALSTVVFRYIPEHNSLDGTRVNAVLRQRLFERGIAVIGHTRVRDMQCLKLTCMNPMVSEEQLRALLNVIVQEGSMLERETVAASGA